MGVSLPPPLREVVLFILFFTHLPALRKIRELPHFDINPHLRASATKTPFSRNNMTSQERHAAH